MPTNFLRKRPPVQGRVTRPHVPVADRVVWLQVGAAGLAIKLHATETADRIWHALPLHSIVETWGESLHFEIPLRIGRDRTARINGRAGEVYYWIDDERIVLPWGPTPISRDHEIRLMRPCNVWGEVIGNARMFEGLVPGPKCALTRAAKKS
ncbi:MAG: cyclophilin-like family protein [Pseudomonadota bacterium]